MRASEVEETGAAGACALSDCFPPHEPRTGQDPKQRVAGSYENGKDSSSLGYSDTERTACRLVLLAGSETDVDDECLVECVGPHGVAAARPCPPDWPSMTRESKRSALSGSAGVVPACREAAGGLVGERVLGRVEVCRGEPTVPPVPGGQAQQPAVPQWQPTARTGRQALEQGCQEGLMQ